MNTPQTRELAEEIVQMVAAGNTDGACDLLSTVLAERTPFRLLDIIGERIGALNSPQYLPLLDRIAQGRSEGGWVVIASALHQSYSDHPRETLSQSRMHIIDADVWYATDIFGERVAGPSLVSDFDGALGLLDPWRCDPNRWVRRCVGVSVHLWAKRGKGNPQYYSQVREILEFLASMFSEWEMDAVKGIAWGLKTMGRYYPDEVTAWLIDKIIPEHKKYRAHMMRKATLFLSDQQKEEITNSINKIQA